MNDNIRARDVILSLLGCALVFAFIESGLRIAETVRGDLQVQPPSVSAAPGWSVYSPDLGWIRRPGFHGKTEIDGIVRQFDENGYFIRDDSKIASEQAANRVLFIGDANFGAFVQPSDTFVEAANRALPEISAINLGVAGYSSYQGAHELPAYLDRLHPVAVVATFSANDRREIYPGQAPDGPERFRAQHRAELADAAAEKPNPLDSFRLYRAFSRLLNRGVKAGSAPKTFRLDQLRPRVDEDAYRRNLSQIADLCAARGIPVIFVLLRDNPLVTGYFPRAIENIDQGNYADAIEYLNRLAKRPNSFTHLARVYMARAYEGLGDKQAAARLLTSSDFSDSIEGGAPIRLDSTYNAIMTEVAREKHAELADAASVLAADPYVYVDEVHFNALGHKRIGDLIAARLAQVLRIGQPQKQKSSGSAE